MSSFRYSLSSDCRYVIERAEKYASRYQHSFITSQHVLYSLLRYRKCKEIHDFFKNVGIDPSEISLSVRDRLDAETSTNPTGAPSFSPRIKEIITAAAAEAINHGTRVVSLMHLLIGIFKKETGLSAMIDNDYGLNITTIREYLELNDDKYQPREIKSSSKPEKMKDDKSTLEKYTKDFTQLAREGKLSTVIGRDIDIERVIQTLMRKSKNNPVILGDPGVGKTAIVEGLATMIVDGDVPVELQNKVILSLDLPLMLAGTKYRGQFEERLTEVIESVTDSNNIILFLDELHMMVGAGNADGAMDASNILKPSLARGEINMIGATTLDEYRKHIESDGALERRFQPITIKEPSKSETVQILCGVKHKFERFHNMVISQDCVETIVHLCDRYITSRNFPDKAIDVLDEACSMVKIDVYRKYKTNPVYLQNAQEANEEMKKHVEMKKYDVADQFRNEETMWLDKIDRRHNLYKRQHKITREMNEDHISLVISNITGIPMSNIKGGDHLRVRKLKAYLDKTVIGQSEAVDIVTTTIKRSKAGLNNPNRPIGSFLFVGPTGVGKTYITKCMSEVLFDSADNIIRVDMSEMMEKHSVSKLIGSPPGYVGYETGGDLTERIRRNPYSIVLFDEIEKAHPDVLNVMLQILDEGHVTDAHGRLINFKNTIVILTSNIGADKIVKDKNVGFLGVTDTESDVKQEIHNMLRPEFINRLDEIVVFNELSQDDLKSIAKLALQDLNDRLMTRGKSIKYTTSVVKWVVDQNEDNKFGARSINRIVQKQIETVLADHVLVNPDQQVFKLRCRRDKLFVE